MTERWGQSGGDRTGIGESRISRGEDGEDLAGKNEKERCLLDVNAMAATIRRGKKEDIHGRT